MSVKILLLEMIKIGIVGAGSAGLFAAYKIGQNCNSNVNIKIFDQGPEVDKRFCPMTEGLACQLCYPCKIMSGIGGAGAFSSGILNLNKEIGGELDELCENTGLEADNIIKEIDDFFVQSGAPNKVFDPFNKENVVGIKELQKKSVAADVRFIPIRQRLLGSKNTPKVIKNMIKFLEDNFNVTILSKTRIMSFSANKEVEFEDGTTEKFDFLLIAPGRWGMEWLARQCNNLKIKTFHEALDIGVRVEVPAIIMENVCNIQRDPKFHIITPTYKDFVRTFCVNHQGYVIKETYENNIAGVNGHQYTLSGDSENSNFAFLIRQHLTSPLEDTSKYGRSISFQTSVLGGYKPLIQTLGDLRSANRSRESLIKKNPVPPSLKDATPGDIAMAYPYRFVVDILEGLEILDKIIPGVANNSTLLYAPEFKRSAKRIETNNYLGAKEIKGLYFAGDGAGLSRGIIAAALTGIIAAEGIIKDIHSKSKKL